MHIGKILGLGLGLMLMLGRVPLYSQDTLSSAVVEQKSYAYYEQKNWNALIHFGRTALSRGYDYYYLRMRIGIAYYEKGDYLLADKQFEKALEFNSGDTNAEEYLYFCYLYTGRFEEARKLSKSFSPAEAKRMGTDNLSKVGFILLEGGAKTSDSSNLFHTAAYFQAGLGHYVHDNYSLFHALTYYSESEFRGHTTQFQYYLRANIPVKKDWLISPAFQWLNRAYNAPPGPGQNPPGPGMGGGGHQRPPPPNQAPTVIFNNYLIGSLQVRKKIGHVDLILGSGVTNLNNTTEIMHQLGLVYSPFGNSRMQVGCQGYLVTSDSYTSTQKAYSPFICVRPWKRLALSMAYLNNEAINLVEGNGYIINNSDDLTFERWSYQASLLLGKHVEIYALYQLESKKESIDHFIYHYNAIIGGLKIIP